MPQQVVVDSVTVDGNFRVGIGVTGGEEQGPVVIPHSWISNTQLMSLLVLDGSGFFTAEPVADGLRWNGGIAVSMEEVTLSGNGR